MVYIAIKTNNRNILHQIIILEIASIKMLVNNPARISSLKIPGPFLIFLSTHEIGHGLQCQKNEKIKMQRRMK